MAPRTCAFEGQVDSMIWDQIVACCQSSKFTHKLLQVSNISLKDMLKTRLLIKIAHTLAMAMENNNDDAILPLELSTLKCFQHLKKTGIEPKWVQRKCEKILTHLLPSQQIGPLHMWKSLWWKEPLCQSMLEGAIPTPVPRKEQSWSEWIPGDNIVAYCKCYPYLYQQQWQRNLLPWHTNRIPTCLPLGLALWGASDCKGLFIKNSSKGLKVTIFTRLSATPPGSAV